MYKTMQRTNTPTDGGTYTNNKQITTTIILDDDLHIIMAMFTITNNQLVMETHKEKYT